MAEPLIVQPIPTNLTEVLAWFASLDVRDLSNALLGAFTVAFLGLLLVLGTMVLLRLRRA